MWCSNPEGRGREPALLHSHDRCIGTDGCDRCLPVCREAAIAIGEDHRIAVDRARCDGCGECADVCPTSALEVSGQWLSVADVLAAVEEDDAFYARSGGGLTVSGGEPLAQGEFVVALLGEARSRGIDTAVETSGLCNWKTLRAVASLSDQLFFDIKCLDERKHVEGTGVSNAKILDNFRRLRRELADARVTVRTPIIPGFNDDETEIRAIARFIENAGGAHAYELLPYHQFGEAKYARLGTDYRLSDLRPPSEERMRALEGIAMRLN
jgi:pyruvate formate lyase activating enzyme